jgi:two-component system LytT family sensor kinase
LSDSALPKPAQVSKLYSFVRRRPVYNLVMWVGVVLFFSLINSTGDVRFWEQVKYEAVNCLFYAVIVYFVWNYLIPNYLSPNKFSTFILLMVLSVVLLTPIHNLAIYLMYSGNEVFQRSFVEGQWKTYVSNLLIACIATAAQTVRDWAWHRRQVAELENQNMRSELSFLKSQINPHFLFNTLNSIYALSLKKSDLAPDMVLKLSDMMRYMLYESNERRVLLSKEIGYLNNYIDLERLRYGGGADIRLDVQGDPAEYTIAPLLFINFVENSFKHGLSNKASEASYVHISFEIGQQALIFVCSNSIREQSSTLPTQVGGIGLHNVKRRLDLLYPKQYQLDMQTADNHYTVTLKINLV